MSAILGTYARRPVSFSHGKGCYLYSTQNEKFLDLVVSKSGNTLETIVNLNLHNKPKNKKILRILRHTWMI